SPRRLYTCAADDGGHQPERPSRAPAPAQTSLQGRGTERAGCAAANSASSGARTPPPPPAPPLGAPPRPPSPALRSTATARGVGPDDRSHRPRANTQADALEGSEPPEADRHTVEAPTGGLVFG